MMPVFYEIYKKIPEQDTILSLFPVLDMRQDKMMIMRSEQGLELNKYTLTEYEFSELHKRRPLVTDSQQRFEERRLRLRI